MKLSIALVTMDREEQLINAINSCLSCELPAKTEFVIIDNCSKDNTEKVVKEFFLLVNIHIYMKNNQKILELEREEIDILSCLLVNIFMVWMMMRL